MILEVKNLTKLYRNGRGVEDISFTLSPGDVLGLLGPNGSGKTTTMKAITGLVHPKKGDINICGIDAIDCHEAAMHHVGCLIEAPALYDYMTAVQNLRQVARYRKGIDSRRIEEVLRMVGMDGYKRDKVRSFSLGMRQRTGLAITLLAAPKLLILDEPFNGLDIEGMHYVRTVINLAAQNGSAVLISSHLASEVQQCATKAAIMHSGKLLAVDTMDTILQKHDNLEDYFLKTVGVLPSQTPQDFKNLDNIIGRQQ
ncbi:MAG: ABC transporter ATP-binding protein [Defluviitaleaceae bacterium]|nr:ABC transporter ATP-binding protein [Defluviitaleaceae bacterium]